MGGPSGGPRRVTLDGPLILAEVDVGTATVVVDPGAVRVEADSFVVILDGPLICAEAVAGETTVVVGVGIEGRGKESLTDIALRFGVSPPNSEPEDINSPDSSVGVRASQYLAP